MNVHWVARIGGGVLVAALFVGAWLLLKGRAEGGELPIVVAAYRLVDGELPRGTRIVAASSERTSALRALDRELAAELGLGYDERDLWVACKVRSACPEGRDVVLIGYEPPLVEEDRAHVEILWGYFKDGFGRLAIESAVIELEKEGGRWIARRVVGRTVS